eukprot:9054801-Pyramimonas_sp.AAC.1
MCESNNVGRDATTHERASRMHPTSHIYRLPWDRFAMFARRRKNCVPFRPPDGGLNGDLSLCLLVPLDVGDARAL